LAAREKELEDVDQTYRGKLHKLQENYNISVRDIEHKYQVDIEKVKQETAETYKQAVAKTKAELERAQIVVQKLKKTNLDSDKVIDSLKVEMNKMKEGHLNEVTSMKMSSEREKESLKERCEQYVQRLSGLEGHLKNADERMREECEAARSSVKQEFVARMKEMAKAHASALEMARKHEQNNRLVGLHQTNKTCQTETSAKDIELLETFRQKYLETLAKMKCKVFLLFFFAVVVVVVMKND